MMQTFATKQFAKMFGNSKKIGLQNANYNSREFANQELETLTVLNHRLTGDRYPSLDTILGPLMT